MSLNNCSKRGRSGLFIGRYCSIRTIAGENPAVAAAPENFRPVRLGLVEERAVTEKEVVVGAVKIIRRAPPIRHREIQVARVARRRVKACPRRRRHEERVAPRPLIVAGLGVAKSRSRRADWRESSRSARASAQSSGCRGRENKARRRPGRSTGRRRGICGPLYCGNAQPFVSPLASIASRYFGSPEIPASAIMPTSPTAQIQPVGR